MPATKRGKDVILTSLENRFDTNDALVPVDNPSWDRSRDLSGIGSLRSLLMVRPIWWCSCWRFGLAVGARRWKLLEKLASLSDPACGFASGSIHQVVAGTGPGTWFYATLSPCFILDQQPGWWFWLSGRWPNLAFPFGEGYFS